MAQSVATMRSLAAEAGVTPMTVSLALRNSHKISADTRLRIRRLAAARGYRPDPAVNKLMHYLRQRTVRRLQATICCLRPRADPTAPDAARWRYIEQLQTGLQERGEALGYAMDIMYTDAVESGERF